MSNQREIHPWRARRIEAGLTQTQLAARIGVSMMSVLRWERGYCAPDRWKTRAWDKALRVQPQKKVANTP
jgi:transcriptional regulator with XRE-family HTH domain